MFSKTPTKGMRDFLPAEYAFRQKILDAVQQSYGKFGFLRIETPCVESLELLTSKQGGDNEKLIFKILKRGEKLENADDGQQCDLGLRYDLTVPLARYYANNVGSLPPVFKAMQIGNVWRADRPQKGRFRQFVQCDIDIIGENTNLAEIELITATTEALAALGLRNVTIRLSDRRILAALVEHCGFLPQNAGAVLIALDKMDKIGVVGVMEEIELVEPGKSELFISLVSKISSSARPLDTCLEVLKGKLASEVAENIAEILYVTKNSVKNGQVVFDITLVRGMDYYTGTIFEISLDGLNLSAGGGGRYDKLIGKICGTDAPACGFSIGFERIAMVLSGSKQFSENTLLTAIIVPKDASPSQISSVYESAAHLRKTSTVTVVKKIKNFTYQLEQLKAQGATVIYEYRQNNLVKLN